MLEKIKGFLSPYSVEGLRLRANRLPDCPYKVLLTLSAFQLENGKVTEDAVRKAVEYFRSGNYNLLLAGVRLLNLSHEQLTETLGLLKTGKIKDIPKQAIALESDVRVSQSSIKEEVAEKLSKNPLLKPKDLCHLLGLDYQKYCDYITHLRSVWKHDLKNRQALKCLSFHAARGWVFALGSVDRGVATSRGWVLSRARNHMLVFRDGLGRLEWHVNGRVNFWVRKPATWGRVLQLLAKGFTWTGLIQDVEVFELWARSAKFKGAHLTYDLGERIPYARIEYLKDALGVVVKTGDTSHPTSVEIEFVYPDWAERNERLLQSLLGLGQNGTNHVDREEPSYRV